MNGGAATQQVGLSKTALSNKATTVGTEFLMQFFAGTEHDVEIRCLPSREQFFSKDYILLEKFVKQNIEKQNIYFGCCTREGKKGDKSACREVIALWLDLDFKGLAGGQAEADSIIDGMIPPSAIMCSGNGYHIYWLLREPEIATAEKIEPYLRGLADRYKGDIASAELARVLRVPGTFNYKDGGKKPVTIITADYDLRYNLSDFDDLVIQTKSTTTDTSRKDGTDVINEGQRNSTLTSLAGTMRRRGMSEAEIGAAIHAVSKARCKPPLLDHEVDGIAKSVCRYESKPIHPSSGNKLIEQFGEPYYLNRDGSVIGINEAYWAGFHADENIELYEPDEKSFYRYQSETGLYTAVSENCIKQEISAQILDVSRSQNLPSLERKKTNSNLNSIVSHLRGITEKCGAFTRDRKSIHVGNGIIVFNDDGDADLCDFSPEFYSRNQSPISFDPDARCDRFLDELIYPAVSEDNALILQKYAGLCLLGKNLIQRFLILDGFAGTGKTQFVLAIQKIVGHENVSELRTKHLSDRFEIFRYLKKSLLVGVDTPGNFLSEKGAYVIKGLVGGDYFDAEKKGETGCFPLQGNFCIMLTSNSRLQVRLDGDLPAWRRRLLIVRYEGKPPQKRIPDFADLLIQQEGSGILNWALAGLGMLLEDIGKYGDIQLAPEQASIVDSLLAESDSLRIYLKENIENHEHGDLSIQEIIEGYAQFCPVKRWNPKPITVIYRELEGLMLELFGSSKAHSLTREGKTVKGFRRVKFLTGKGNDE